MLYCCVGFCHTTQISHNYIYRYRYTKSISIYIFSFLSLHSTALGCHRVSGRASCAVQQLPSKLPILYLCVQSLSRVWLFATLMYCSLPGSTVHGILQARILGWVAISSSRGSSWLRDQVHVSLMCLLHCRQILYHWATGETMVVYICQYCILNLSHFFPCYILSNFKKQLFCS